MDKQKILIVDDTKENLLILSHSIALLDVEIIKTTSPMKALELAQEHDFFIFLLDVEMPDMNGFQLAQGIRQNKKNEEIPIIFVSAIHTTNIDIFEGYNLGAVDYLIKPINPFILKSKVNTFLSLAKAIKLRETYSHDLLIANEKQKETNHKMQEFVAVVAHDLRSPLGSIHSICSLLKGDDINSKERRELISFISSISKNSIELVDEFLDIVTISTGNVPLKKIHFDMKELVDDILVEINYKANVKNLKVYQKNRGKNRNVFADIKRLRQVLINLLINAIKFTEQKKNIIVELNFYENNMRFSIIDQGIGIPKSMIPKLFDKSMHCSRIGTQGEEGTGFGLPLANEIIIKHGSEITVESEEKKGSTFMFDLFYN